MPLGWMLSGGMLGTALQLRQEALWPAWAYLAAGLTGLAGFAFTRVALRAARVRGAGVVPVIGRWPPMLAALALLAGSAALASFALTGLRAGAFAAHALPLEAQGRDIVVRGVVAAMPQQGDLGTRFVFDVESSPDAALPPRLLLSWYGAPASRTEPAAAHPARTSEVLRAGQRWEFVVRLKSPHGPCNPHGFDFELWLWERGIQATGYVRTADAGMPPRLLAQDAWPYALERGRQAVRDALLEQVADPRRAGVLAGLAVGDQRAIERADWDLFRTTGVAHLMSISGLHVTMFAWLATALVGALYRRSARLCLAWPAPHAALVAGVLLAALYAAFSGGGIPAQRTVWMLATLCVLRLAGLRWPWPIAWLLAGAAVVLIDPWALLQPGFWLSFVAVGVLFAADPGRPASPHAAPATAAACGMRARLRALLREQAVVTVALAPLTLWLFGEVSLVGLAANLLAIPWVTAVVTPLAIAGALWAPLWHVGAGAVGVLAWGLELLALLPGAVWSAAASPPWVALAAMAGGLLLALRLPPVLRLQGLPLLLPMLLWQPVRPAPGHFELVAADIGQGNAVIVRTASYSLLYDTGPRHGADSDAGHRVLVPLLRALGDRLDRVVVSHRDSDHIGGAASVLARHEGATLLSSIDHGHDLAVRHAHERCLAGRRWTWDGVTFEFLHPRAQDYGVRSLRPNTVSCVLRITASAGGGHAALLAGDIEAAQERRLAAEAGDLLRADLLLVPHHGSKTSSSDAFLVAVAPRVALVQAGYRNRYGHPAEVVLARYAARGIAVVASPGCGAAHWSSDDPGSVRCERQASRRYWHHPGP